MLLVLYLVQHTPRPMIDRSLGVRAVQQQQNTRNRNVMVRSNNKKKKKGQGGRKAAKNGSAAAVTAAVDPFETPTAVANPFPDPASATFSIYGREVPTHVYNATRNVVPILESSMHLGSEFPKECMMSDPTTGTIGDEWHTNAYSMLRTMAVTSLLWEFT